MTMFSSDSMSGLFLLFVTTSTLLGLVFNDDCSAPMSRDAAAKCCEVHGSVPPLPMPLSLGDNKLLYKKLLGVNMTGTWLGLRRNILNEFRWLNGTVEKLQGNTTDKHCSAINVTSNLKQADFCNTEAYGYICERKDCVGCASLGIWKDYCVKDRGRCFILLCETESWFNARSRCIQKGWDLATTVNIPSFRRLRCSVYWVGLTREKWIQDGGTELKNHTNWGVGQPETVGNCVRFTLLPEERYEWTVFICSEQKSFVCQAHNGSVELRTAGLKAKSEVPGTTIDIETTQETSLVTGNYPLAVLVSVFGTLAVIVVIVGVVCILMNKPWRKHAAYSRKGKLGPTEEEIALLSPEHTRINKEYIRQRLAKEYIKHAVAGHCVLDRNPEPMRHFFTNLVMIDRSGSGTKLESHFDLLQKNGDTIRVVLFGGAGTGKTTLCRKILTDWGNIVFDTQGHLSHDKTPILKKFQYIVSITLRFVSDNQTLFDIICSQFNLNREETVDLIDGIKSNEAGALFILDGYDEYDPETSADVTKLINGDLLPGVNLMVTTKYIVDNLDSNQTVPMKQVSLIGFSKEGVYKYVDEYFENERQRDRLLARIGEQKELANLGIVPAILHSMCSVWKEKKYLCTTLTSFYSSVVNHVCQCYEERKKKLAESSGQEDVFNEYKADFTNLGEFLISGIIESQRQEVDKDIQRPSLNLGLLTCNKGQLAKSSQQHSTFMEQCMQEYSAASCMDLLPESQELLETLLISSPEPDVKTVITIQFRAGLCITEHIPTEHTEDKTYMILLVDEKPEQVLNKRFQKNAYSIRSASYTIQALSCFVKKDCCPEHVGTPSNTHFLGYISTKGLERLIRDSTK